MKKMFLPIMVVFALATHPASISAVQDATQNSWASPFALISQTWQKITQQAQKHPYIALGAVFCTALYAAYYYKHKQPVIEPKAALFFDKATEEINKDSKLNPVRTKNKSNDAQGEFKNIASIVDLTLLVPGQKTVELEPGNKKTMTHLEYYNYLKEKNNSEALKKFVEGLIGEVIKKYPNIFYSKNETHNNKEKIATLTNILLNEEKYKHKIVFYHGYKGTLSFFHDFVETIHRYLDLIKKPTIRSRFENNELFESSDKLLLNCREIRDWGLSSIILSTNTTLFGNTLNPGYIRENSLKCFYENHKCPDTQNLVNSLCKTLGLSYSKALQDLYTKYEKIGGILKQFFISPEHTDKISYISTPYGHAYKQRTGLQHYDKIGKEGYIASAESLIKSISGTKFPKTPCWDILHEFYLTTHQIIKQLRTDTKEISINTIDRLQARILFYSNPFLDPAERKRYGIKQFDFYTTPEKQKLRENLRKEMDLLVKKLLWESLENHTLTNGAEKTKLVTMYKKDQQKI